MTTAFKLGRKTRKNRVFKPAAARGARVCIVDADPERGRRLGSSLSVREHDVLCVPHFGGASSYVRDFGPDILALEVDSDPVSAVRLAKILKRNLPVTPRIVFYSEGPLKEDVKDNIVLGAHDTLITGINAEKLIDLVENTTLKKDTGKDDAAGMAVLDNIDPESPAYARKF